jgi:hypothetical protein
MSILDNLEAYLDFEDRCHYCKEKAKYTDIAGPPYQIIGVCQCHFVQETP